MHLAIEKKRDDPISLSDVERIARKARKSIGRYCIEECHAYCCRKGYLELNEEEFDLVAHSKKNTIIKEGTAPKGEEGMYLLDLAKENCPSLQDFKCIIHKNPGRPKACIEFPLFIWEKKVIHLSNRCVAVRENLLFPYVERLSLMGYKIDNGPDLILD